MFSANKQIRFLPQDAIKIILIKKENDIRQSFYSFPQNPELPFPESVSFTVALCQNAYKQRNAIRSLRYTKETSKHINSS